jgi:uncharacterized protein
MSSRFVGVGLRPTHYPYLESKLSGAVKNSSTASPAIRSKWFEAISENYMDSFGRPYEMLMKIRAYYPVALHGVSLSIGSTDELDFNYLKKLKSLIERVEPMIVSDHLCWSGAHGRNLHDLLPLPFTETCVSHVVERIERVQNFLGRQMLFENVSSYVRFAKNDFSEWDFINEIARRSGAGILLDLNNVYVNAHNHGFDPSAYVDAVDVKNVGQLHLAGFTDMGEFFFDTHSRPVVEPVWQLYSRFMSRKPEVPVLIEWDEDIPPFEVLERETRRALEVSA